MCPVATPDRRRGCSISIIASLCVLSFLPTTHTLQLAQNGRLHKEPEPKGPQLPGEPRWTWDLAETSRLTVATQFQLPPKSAHLLCTLRRSLHPTLAPHISTRHPTTTKMNRQQSSPMQPAMVFPCPILTRLSESAKMAHYSSRISTSSISSRTLTESASPNV